MQKQDSHFLALRPPHPAKTEMQRVRDAGDLSGTAIRDEHLHVTLVWFGYDPPDARDLVTAARAAAETVAAQPFRIMFDQVIGAECSLLLKPSEPLHHLHAFQHHLAAALSRHGLKAGKGWRFDPHITLRRGPGGSGVHAIDPIAWSVTEFVLIQSLIGHTRHETLGTWPLTD